MMLRLDDIRLAVIGHGYVGFPASPALARMLDYLSSNDYVA